MDHRKAYRIYHKALKTGDLVKPKVCPRCGSTKAIQGHHRDYDKPLEVIWLCAKCHRIEHGFHLTHGFRRS